MALGEVGAELRAWWRRVARRRGMQRRTGPPLDAVAHLELVGRHGRATGRCRWAQSGAEDRARGSGQTRGTTGVTNRSHGLRHNAYPQIGRSALASPLGARTMAPYHEGGNRILWRDPVVTRTSRGSSATSRLTRMLRAGAATRGAIVAQRYPGRGGSDGRFLTRGAYVVIRVGNVSPR